MKAFDGGEHNSTHPDEANDSPWVSGAVEIQLQEGLQPEVRMASNGAMCEFDVASDASALGALNEMLLKNACRQAVPIFETTADEVAGARAMSLEPDVEVPDLSGFYTLYFPEGQDVRAIVEELRQLPEVLHAARLPTTKPACPHTGVLPGELLLGQDDQTQALQWYIFRCRIERAWRLGYTGKGVVIADIDWGFMTTHPDLASRFNMKMAHNSADNSCDVSQGGNLSHGTAVMGLAGAAANNTGMIGVAHDAELWPIQVNVTPQQVVEPLSWARAIEWVTKANSGNKRKVMILEGQTSEAGNITQIASIRAAVQYAIACGLVVCVPAGNRGRPVEIDDDGNRFDPAGIIVGATFFDDQPHTDSNYGPSVVVSAPGDDNYDLTCTDDPQKLHKLEFGGTSGATAKVAGAVALMLEANQYLRHADIKEILSKTGTTISIDMGNFLNCEEAVLAALTL